MNKRPFTHVSAWSLGGLLLLFFMLMGCARELSECGGPTLDLNSVLGDRYSLFSQSNGARAVLVVPNPLDAADYDGSLLASGTIPDQKRFFNLIDLLGGTGLQSQWLKVHVSNTEDAQSLASPDGAGVYDFAFNDIQYSQTMAYYSISAMRRYVESLGFGLQDNREFYVLVNSGRTCGDEIAQAGNVEACYEHNYLDPTSHRVMRMVGDGEVADGYHPPGKDRDMYWHEFGHHVNELLSNEAGIDYAVDKGAIFTEASALHECLADYLAESVGNKAHIGRWLGYDLDTVPDGEPMRRAVDSPGNTMDFSTVIANTGQATPERYTVAEWCTRVLWDIRQQFVTENPDSGAVFADRMILQSLAELRRDTSIAQFQTALVASDEGLHCGLHSRSIKEAFESRGFEEDPSSISSPISIEASAVGEDKDDPSQHGPVEPGKNVTFQIRLRNSNSETARNVRVKLESLNNVLVPYTYMQAYGDLSPGQELIIGGPSAQLGYAHSPLAKFNENVRTVNGIAYRLYVQVENGPNTVYEGVLR